MEQTGIEPISSELQSAALTNFATVPLRCLSRFELDLGGYTSRASHYTIDIYIRRPERIRTLTSRVKVLNATITPQVIVNLIRLELIPQGP